MSTTKPDTETGWTKEFPAIDGYYWMRFAPDDRCPMPVRYDNGYMHEIGVADDMRWVRDTEKAEFLPASPSDFEQLIRLRKEVVDLRVDQQAVRALYDLPNEGDFYEQMADHLEYDAVDKVRLQNAVWNLLTETFYEEGLKNNGVAVRFLMRLHLLACEAGLPEYSKDNPVVAEAIAALGDPAENSPESLAAAGRRREALAPTGEKL